MISRIGILLLAALTALCVFANPLFAKDASQGIVVWRLEKKQGVTDQEIDSISGFVAAETERLSGRKVISESDIKTILKGEETRQQCGADDTSCVAEIGAALGVPETVAGDLGRVGDFWFLNLKRIHVRNAEVIKRASRNVEGDINALLRVLPDAMAELFGKEPRSSAGVASKTGTTGVEQAYPMNPYKKYGYVTFFTGVGLSAFGGIAAWQASAKGGDYEAGDRSANSASKGWEGAMYASFAVGGAAMITGVVLWALSPGDKAWAERQQVSVAPMLDSTNVGATVSFSW